MVGTAVSTHSARLQRQHASQEQWQEGPEPRTPTEKVRRASCGGGLGVGGERYINKNAPPWSRRGFKDD